MFASGKKSGGAGAVFNSRCKTYCDTTVSVPTNTATKIPLNTKIYDLNSEFDTVLNRFICKIAGEYVFKGQVMLSDMADPMRMWVSIYVNGSTRGSVYVLPNADASSWTILQQAVLEEQLEVDDYVELFVFQSGSARNIGIESFQTWFSAHRVG